MPSLPDWLKEIADRDGLGDDKEKAEKDAKWVDDFCDNLTVAIALRGWEEAVGLIEDGNEIIPSANI